MFDHFKIEESLTFGSLLSGYKLCWSAPGRDQAAPGDSDAGPRGRIAEVAVARMDSIHATHAWEGAQQRGTPTYPVYSIMKRWNGGGISSGV